MRTVQPLSCLGGPLALTAGGCAPTDNGAREQAETVGNSVVERQFPKVSVAPVTDCVIDAACAGKITFTASEANTDVKPDTVTTVLEIASRPESVNSIAEKRLARLA